MTALALVIPARNESTVTGRTVAGALRWLLPGDALFVIDHGATDGTGDVAAAAGQFAPRRGLARRALSADGRVAV